MKRTLSLRSEALTELMPMELRDVAGGNTTKCPSHYDCQTPGCPPTWEFLCMLTEQTRTIAIDYPTQGC